jgi:hypothetical protein
LHAIAIGDKEVATLLPPFSSDVLASVMSNPSAGAGDGDEEEAGEAEAEGGEAAEDKEAEETAGADGKDEGKVVLARSAAAHHVGPSASEGVLGVENVRLKRNWRRALPSQKSEKVAVPGLPLPLEITPLKDETRRLRSQLQGSRADFEAKSKANRTII